MTLAARSAAAALLHLLPQRLGRGRVVQPRAGGRLAVHHLRAPARLGVRPAALRALLHLPQRLLQGWTQKLSRVLCNGREIIITLA
jgi:hypothetical protein